MRILILVAILAGCQSGPYLNTGISIGPGGVGVYPSVSGRVGGVGVAVGP
ncbi:hypothetical protein QCN27_06395 [Cereibacter sp. SYSU M97828]|nr:hypothetical protein [Cereibacter flavus]